MTFILCNQIRESVTKQVGLITLTPSCVIETKYSQIADGIDREIEYKAPELYIAESPEWKPNLSENDDNLAGTTKSTEDLKKVADNIAPPVVFKDHAVFIHTDDHWTVGMVLGGVIFLVALILCIVIIVCKNRQRNNSPVDSASMSRTYLNFDPVRRQLNNFGERFSTLSRSLRRTHQHPQNLNDLMETANDAPNYINQTAAAQANAEMRSFSARENPQEENNFVEVELNDFRRTMIEAQESLKSPVETPKAIKPIDLPAPPRSWRLSGSSIVPHDPSERY